MVLGWGQAFADHGHHEPLAFVLLCGELADVVVVGSDGYRISAAGNLGGNAFDDLKHESGTEQPVEPSSDTNYLDVLPHGNFGCQSLVKEEGIDLVLGVLGHPARVEQVGEVVGQIVDRVGIDAQSLERMLLGFDTQQVEDFAHALCRSCGDRAPKWSAKEKETPDVLDNGLGTGPVRALLPVVEELSRNETAKAVGNDDNGPVCLSLWSHQP